VVWWRRSGHRIASWCVYLLTSVSAFSHSLGQFRKSARLVQRSAFRPQADIFDAAANFPDWTVSRGSAGTPNCLGVATTCASLIFRQRTLNPVTPMPTVMVRATTILGEFEQVRAELVGTAVMLTDGKAGTVETVWLDELHGLLISIRGHDGKWPVSTVKLREHRWIGPRPASGRPKCRQCGRASRWSVATDP